MKYSLFIFIYLFIWVGKVLHVVIGAQGLKPWEETPMADGLKSLRALRGLSHTVGAELLLDPILVRQFLHGPWIYDNWIVEAFGIQDSAVEALLGRKLISSNQTDTFRCLSWSHPQKDVGPYVEILGQTKAVPHSPYYSTQSSDISALSLGRLFIYLVFRGFGWILQDPMV